jgi:hypothetical protein
MKAITKYLYRWPPGNAPGQSHYAKVTEITQTPRGQIQIRQSYTNGGQPVIAYLPPGLRLVTLAEFEAVQDTEARIKQAVAEALANERAVAADEAAMGPYMGGSPWDWKETE